MLHWHLFIDFCLLALRYQQNELQPPLTSDGQQFHQYQQNELQPPLNSDGHQFHKHQQNEQSPHLKWTHWTQKDHKCDFGNPGPCMGQT